MKKEITLEELESLIEKSEQVNFKYSFNGMKVLIKDVVLVIGCKGFGLFDDGIQTTVDWYCSKEKLNAEFKKDEVIINLEEVKIRIILKEVK